MTKDREQWIRYRKEISFLINTIEFDLKNNKFESIKDYFSDCTLNEILNKEPLEGLDE